MKAINLKNEKKYLETYSILKKEKNMNTKIE
jgi:hypothetical protein